ncbi:hypothetical protein MVEN_00937500 [Mycena venus]|uniref:Uncharacterized protein n=1 Tax=Mycena venus TaxID=2733690 RepID=A0A8H6YCZ5_9AGAR|nr:hypothetical protein MVEN_00937500 [Mycena venus]
MGEELKVIRAKYEALKLSLVPQLHVKRKHEADGPDFEPLAPAFRQQPYSPSQTNQSPRQNMPPHLSYAANTTSQFLSPRFDTTPTTPQRPSMFTRLSTDSESSSTSTTTSPRASPIPGLQAELRTSGSNPSMSARLNTNTNTSTPTTPTMSDSLRSTDPRKRAKFDANQTTPTPIPIPTLTTSSVGNVDQNASSATPTTTKTKTTTHITQTQTQTQFSAVQQTNDGSANSNSNWQPFRGMLPVKPQPLVHEGPRIPSENRKRTISLSAKPLRSPSRSRRQEMAEAGEILERQEGGYSSTSSESS